MAKSKSFKIPVISCWKYAGAWASPKGILMYLYLPKGELNAVLGIEDLSRVYGGNHIINPRLKNTLHHLILRKYPQL